MKYFKFFEFAYLGFAVFFIYEAIRKWNEPSQQKYIFLAIALMAVFMFFFKRRFRKKTEAQEENQKNK